jgi:hypothetical protein
MCLFGASKREGKSKVNGDEMSVKIAKNCEEELVALGVSGLREVERKTPAGMPALQIDC